MNSLIRELTDVLCPGMSIPAEFQHLYDWITANGNTSLHNGRTSGWLAMPGEQAATTGIEFRADGTELLEHWLGTEDRAVIQRLCVFAITGAEGSMAAFWLDDDGGQRIVHMGSGSGSTTVCLLGREPLDFLRLLAIGYDELCWSEDWDEPPSDEDGHPVSADSSYRRWLVTEYGVTVPRTGLDIATPTEMDDEDPADPFARWLTTIEN
ncbi:hypothetical protein [Stackebrandtia nassauensis]|uniref:Uncharacterized protein n=1 Tax=Stackebrandtia nassauensis (strain DSM 44728 / CIP 108903 / NRRL B-16338 / NBRC 102104 / LLR-40K-21) TaxID=446470 RepID=D3PXE9_STANL|nr:hypothetical protein [Stackebrandtia nassauensis]ADD41412.1 hypothetical protein Snas_1713 [Stackebrandtia nassauensis DSM 44728]